MGGGAGAKIAMKREKPSETPVPAVDDVSASLGGNTGTVLIRGMPSDDVEATLDAQLCPDIPVRGIVELVTRAPTV